MDWKNNNIWNNTLKKDNIEKYGEEYIDDIFNIPINIYDVYLKVSSQYEDKYYTKDYTCYDKIYTIGIHPRYKNIFEKEFVDAKIVKSYFVNKDFLDNYENKSRLQYYFAFMEF